MPESEGEVSPTLQEAIAKARHKRVVEKRVAVSVIYLYCVYELVFGSSTNKA
jgi:hypothetical protein